MDAVASTLLPMPRKAPAAQFPFTAALMNAPAPAPAGDVVFLQRSNEISF